MLCRSFSIIGTTIWRYQFFLTGKIKLSSKINNPFKNSRSD